MMSSHGVVFRDLTIDLPFPRLQTDRAVAILQAEILELLRGDGSADGRSVTAAGATDRSTQEGTTC